MRRTAQQSHEWQKVVPEKVASNFEQFLLWMVNAEVWVHGTLPEASHTLFVAPHNEHADTLFLNLAIRSRKPEAKVGVLFGSDYWQGNFRKLFLAALHPIFGVSFLPVLRREYMQQCMRRAKNTGDTAVPQEKARLDQLVKQYAEMSAQFLQQPNASLIVYPQGGRRGALGDTVQKVTSQLLALPNGSSTSEDTTPPGYVPTLIVAPPQYTGDKNLIEKRLRAATLFQRAPQLLSIGFIFGEPLPAGVSSQVLAEQYVAMKTQAEQFGFQRQW